MNVKRLLSIVYSSSMRKIHKNTMSQNTCRFDLGGIQIEG